MEDYPSSTPASSSTPMPASSSAPAGPTTVKVSLDEWATVRRNAGAELMTDGLSGCVAVAVRTDDRIALTHVYSDAYTIVRSEQGNTDRFDDYKPDLSSFIASVGGRDAIREVHLVENGSRVAQGREHSLAGLIQNHLVTSNAVHADRIRTHDDSGCTITSDDLFLKRRDNQSLYVTGYTNTELTGLRADLAEGIAPRLEHGTFACSLARPSPADIEATPRAGSAVAHSPGALYVAPTPEPAPTEVQAEAPRGVRDTMFDQITPALRGNGFGMNSSHLARDLARQADGNGLTEVTRVSVNREGATPRITLEGNERTLEFDAAGRIATLRPAPVVTPVMLTASSSSSPIAESSSPRPDMPASSSSSSLSLSSSSSLYQQAFDALGPQRETLGIRSEPQAIESARLIASHAGQSGLTAISRLEVTTPDGGRPSLIAHQDGVAPKQASPMAVETLQQQAGMAPRDMSQDGPDKARAQNL